MSRIRSRGNKDTEVVLARIFRQQGITGWRRQLQIRIAHPVSRSSQRSTKPYQLTVRPDFVFPKQHLAVFVDGCFWHGCPIHGTKPKGNAAFWKKKFATNIARDRLVNRTLRRAGWRVLRVWEHDLARKRQARLIRRLREFLVFSF